MKIRIVIELSKHLSMNNGDEINFESIFPKFLWVVRDFSLKLSNEKNEPITPNQYLETALSVSNNQNEQDESKGVIKNSLRKYFPNRNCFTLVRPVHEETKLQQISKLGKSEIRFQFIQQIEELKSYIKNQVQPKSLNGRTLNGRSKY
jgi:hypothetical protein